MGDDHGEEKGPMGEEKEKVRKQGSEAAEQKEKKLD